MEGVQKCTEEGGGGRGRGKEGDYFLFLFFCNKTFPSMNM